jgi:phosphoglycolate phosphatase-like HAD superfamily hydrolase
MSVLLGNYLTGLERELALGHCRPERFPGVVELIDALEARADRVLGLLTGNLAEGAAAKLRAVGIDPARFAVAAYGSDHEVRAELPAIALERARARFGTDIPGSALVIIGDTPADIECGRAVGARAIAVATGRYSVEDLAAHDPFAVFADLTDTEAVLRAIDAC